MASTLGQIRKIYRIERELRSQELEPEVFMEKRFVGLIRLDVLSFSLGLQILLDMSIQSGAASCKSLGLQVLEDPAHFVFLYQVAFSDKLRKRLDIRIRLLLPAVCRCCLHHQSSLDCIAGDAQ